MKASTIILAIFSGLAVAGSIPTEGKNVEARQVPCGGIDCVVVVRLQPFNFSISACPGVVLKSCC